MSAFTLIYPLMLTIQLLLGVQSRQRIVEGRISQPYILADLNQDSVPKLRKSGPLVIFKKSNQVIENLEIVGAPGNAIEIKNSENIVIRNCIIRDAVGEAVYIYASKNVEVEQCYFENIRTGVNAVASQTVKVYHNECKNVKGPFPRGQMVQFNNVTGPGNLINYNYALNIFGSSNPEDVISLFESSGTIESPLEVIGNYLNGGGPSTSGGGIMCGDGSKTSENILVRDNVLVNPGQYGIAIVSGRNITVTSNKIFSQKYPWSNVGIYSWKRNALVYENNTMSYNEVFWIKKSGNVNHGWISDDVKLLIKGWNTNIFGTRKVTATMPPPENCGIVAWPGPLRQSH